MQKQIALDVNASLQYKATIFINWWRNNFYLDSLSEQVLLPASVHLPGLPMKAASE